MDKELNADQKDFDFHLPNGEILRTILVRTELTESNLKAVLKSKGVYLPKYSKEDTIPPLMRSLLSPKEYDEIRDLQKFKVEKFKYRTTQIPWQGDKNILANLPDLDLHQLINEKYEYHPGFDLLGVSSFMPVDDRQDKVELQFKIEEHSDIASIHNRNKEFEGSIIIELKEDGHLHLHSTKTFTSKGTQDIVNSIESKLEQHFKLTGSVKKEDSYERIIFKHFSNPNRFLFFIKFIDDIDFLKFKKIVNVNISPDPEKETPEEAREFLKDIDNLNIKGKSLKRHVIISKSEYRKSLWLLSITVQYDFRHSEGEGNCELEYAFPDFKLDESENSEFQFFISKLTIDKKYRATAKKTKIEKAIFKKVDDHKVLNYNLLKT
ncbi:hypothetical protein EJ994_05920 [Maribacter sp. MJ134]|uniref:hypothetical protein n=1 Tax=Maribacter sp. MJ134 TaxID=2496865 RepID=UPI000F847B62|nr:hypothetical protein [Maribacter sp. MJ134]AZQ58363.1 hypothetical protein EJ994_05920 [Maribacter sp. MJ134]